MDNKSKKDDDESTPSGRQVLNALNTELQAVIKDYEPLLRQYGITIPKKAKEKAHFGMCVETTAVVRDLKTGKPKETHIIKDYGNNNIKEQVIKHKMEE